MSVALQKKTVTDTVSPAVAATPPVLSAQSPRRTEESGPPTTPADAAGGRGQRCAPHCELFPQIGRASVVSRIGPHKGWVLCWYDEGDSDGFRTPGYYALCPHGGVQTIQHSRFLFTPTQERFNWLVDNGFPSPREINGSKGPWTDAEIDALIDDAHAASVLAGARSKSALVCHKLDTLAARIGFERPVGDPADPTFALGFAVACWGAALCFAFALVLP